MPRKARILFDGALYHVTSRGNARRTIFHGDDDRERFLEQLGDRAASYGVVVYAFVLMDNHYHLLVRTPVGNLDRFMQRLNTSYALYYRYKHSHPGHVFQGRYKALLVTDDSYLLALTRYIHLNPIKTRAGRVRDSKKSVAWLQGYSWSSYPSYLDGRARFAWLHLDVLDYYGSKRKRAAARYRAYTEAMVHRNDDELADALRRAGPQLGPVIEPVRRASPVTPSPWTFEHIDRIVAAHYAIDPEVLKHHGHSAGEAKRVALALAVRKSGASLQAIGRHYGGISASAVSMNQKRLQASGLSEMAKIEKYSK
jgi:REP element-mobilizing transposase RayT